MKNIEEMLPHDRGGYTSPGSAPMIMLHWSAQ